MPNYLKHAARDTIKIDPDADIGVDTLTPLLELLQGGVTKTPSLFGHARIEGEVKDPEAVIARLHRALEILREGDLDAVPGFVAEVRDDVGDRLLAALAIDRNQRLVYGASDDWLTQVDLKGGPDVRSKPANFPHRLFSDAQTERLLETDWKDAARRVNGGRFLLVPKSAVDETEQERWERVQDTIVCDESGHLIDFLSGVELERGRYISLDGDPIDLTGVQDSEWELVQATYDRLLPNQAEVLANGEDPFDERVAVNSWRIPTLARLNRQYRKTPTFEVLGDLATRRCYIGAPTASSYINLLTDGNWRTISGAFRKFTSRHFEDLGIDPKSDAAALDLLESEGVKVTSWNNGLLKLVDRAEVRDWYLNRWGAEEIWRIDVVR